MIYISVIIPHFNSYDSLVRLLESIGESKFIEVIVVDDGSSDTRIDSVGSIYKNIKLLYNEGSNGAGKCRNIGLEHATYDWVLFADADDVLEDGWYGNIESSCNNIDSNIVFFPPLSKYSDGKPAKRHVTYDKLVKRYLENGDLSLLYWFHVPWSKLYKRKFIDINKLRFSEHIVSNDVLFSLKSSLSCEGNIKVSDLPIYCVIDKPGTLTKDISLDRVEVRLEVLRDYNNILSSNGIKEYTIPEIVLARKIYSSSKCRFFCTIIDGFKRPLCFFGRSSYYIKKLCLYFYKV